MKTVERVSTFKGRNSVLNARASNMCLAVFPFQIEFTGDLDYHSVFYFEKDLQVIGSISNVIPPSLKNKTLTLRDQANLIKFRIYSFQNLNYKWSLYKRYQTGEEEFVQSISIDLKTQLGDLIPLNTASNLRAHEAYLLSCNVDKQMRVKLPKTGAIIKFSFLACEEESQLVESVKDKFFGVNSQLIEQNNLSKYSKQTLSDVPNEKNTDKEVAKAAENYQRGALENEERKNQQKPQELEIQNLDDLILDQNQKNSANEQSNGNRQDEDLCFGVEKQPQSNKRQLEEAKIAQDLKKQQKKANIRDYSLLKLESDQGRITMDPIDRKLELEQLQIIEQEAGISKFNQSSKTYQKQNGALPINTNSSTSKIESVVSFSRSQKNKLIVVFLLIVVTTMVLLFVPTGLKHGKKGINSKKQRKN